MSQLFKNYLATVKIATITEAVDRRFYDKLRKSIRPYSGLDGVTSLDFRTRGETIVASVLKRMKTPGIKRKDGEVRSPSRFTLTPFKRFEIEKKNGFKGEKRPISAASISAIIFQTPTSKFLSDSLDQHFSPNSFAYRPGKSAKQAVEIVAKTISTGQTWVLDADIKKFFDNVDHEILMQLVHQRFPGDELLHTLLRRFLKTGYVKLTKTQKARNIRSTRGGYEPNYKGLPQGGMLSGMLANLYLDGLDQLIVARFPELTYVRYADDFIVLSQNQSDIQSVHRVITDFLMDERGLELNKDKTRIVNLDSRRTHGGRESLDFLGYRFTNGSVIVKPKNIATIRARISSIAHAWSLSDESVDCLISRLTKRLEGHMFDEDSGQFLGRNWVRYFSLVTNTTQFRELDSFLVNAAKHAMRKRGLNVNRAEVLTLPLPSLINLHYKMRRIKQKRHRIYHERVNLNGEQK